MAKQTEKEMKEEIDRLRKKVSEYEGKEQVVAKGAKNDLGKPIKSWKEEGLKERNKNEVTILTEVDELLMGALEAGSAEGKNAMVRRAIGVVRQRADLIFDAHVIGWSEAQKRRGMEIDRTRLRCFACGEEGHTVKECQEARKRREGEREEQWKKLAQERKERWDGGGQKEEASGMSKQKEIMKDGGKKEGGSEGGGELEDMKARMDRMDGMMGEMMYMLRTVAGSSRASDGRERQGNG